MSLTNRYFFFLFGVERESWSSVLRDGVDGGELDILPYTLDVDYSYWSYGQSFATTPSHVVRLANLEKVMLSSQFFQRSFMEKFQVASTLLATLVSGNPQS